MRPVGSRLRPAERCCSANGLAGCSAGPLPRQPRARRAIRRRLARAPAVSPCRRFLLDRLRFGRRRLGARRLRLARRLDAGGGSAERGDFGQAASVSGAGPAARARSGASARCVAVAGLPAARPARCSGSSRLDRRDLRFLGWRRAHRLAPAPLHPAARFPATGDFGLCAAGGSLRLQRGDLRLSARRRSGSAGAGSRSPRLLRVPAHRRRWLVGRVARRGVSTRSSASTGAWLRLCCANIVSGAACHDGLLANSSWAARSSAAAPSPKTSIDIDNTIAANRKRKPGSMDANSAFAGYCKGP